MLYQDETVRRMLSSATGAHELSASMSTLLKDRLITGVRSMCTVLRMPPVAYYPNLDSSKLYEYEYLRVYNKEIVAEKGVGKVIPVWELEIMSTKPLKERSVKGIEDVVNSLAAEIIEQEQELLQLFKDSGEGTTLMGIFTDGSIIPSQDVTSSGKTDTSFVAYELISLARYIVKD